MWSDPIAEEGMFDNTNRGCGVLFGPDVAAEFMANNGVTMVIRSHQCPRRGFELPFGPAEYPEDYPEHLPLLCTIFSASNYCGTGDNDGAYLVITRGPHMRSHQVKGSGLQYSVHYFKATTAEVSAEERTRASLAELIVRKRKALLAAFRALDEEGTSAAGGGVGSVTRVQWAEVMRRVTTISIRWLPMITTIVPKGE